MQAIRTAVRSAMCWSMVLGCVVATMHGEAVQAWGQTADAATDGKEPTRLDLVGTIPARKAMDADISDNHLYFVGANTLWVADLTNASTPAVVGSARFDGNGRQIVVENGVAYVTARADGLYIFDVSAPETPRLLSHYDTIELATGVDVHGDLLCIAERQYGVELVDVSAPSDPRFLSKVQTDEAQSVAIQGHYAYVGNWGASSVTTLDISNPREPRVVSHAELDGFGDGVTVQDGYLYASTGHHSRGGLHSAGEYGGRLLRAENEPGYGAGHGLEILSLADPANPVFVSRVKTPQHFQRGQYDTWTAVASGDYVFCADTYNGVFAVTVSNPLEPRIVARYEELVGGLAVGNGYVYAAFPELGQLAVLDADGMAQVPTSDRGALVEVPPPQHVSPSEHRVYRPGGQIRAVAFVGDYAVVAAGMQGVHVLKLWPEVREVSRIETKGHALHVDARENLIYVSEGREGLSIWGLATDGHFELRGRFEDPSRHTIRRTLVKGETTYAVAESASRFFVIDISDPSRPRKVLEHKAGIIYGDQISHGLVAGRYVCVSDHVTPMRWLDLAADDPKRIDTGIDLAESFFWMQGAAAVGDQLLATWDGGYRLVPALSTGLEQAPTIRAERSLSGKVRVYGDLLFVIRRDASRVAIVDISQIESPRLLGELETDGNPNDAVVRDNALLIPDGYSGLIIYDGLLATLESED